MHFGIRKIPNAVGLTVRNNAAPKINLVLLYAITTEWDIEIESGNKLILQDRLKRAGMRWNTATAQAMLTLKTKVESCIWFRDVEQPFLARCLSNSLTF